MGELLKYYTFNSGSPKYLHAYRDYMLCSIKCRKNDCYAFHIDKSSKKCELGSVVDNGGDNNTWIDVYRKLNENGTLAVAPPTPIGKYNISCLK